MSFSLGLQEFTLTIGRASHLDLQAVNVPRATQIYHPAFVASVQGIGKANDGPELENCLAIRRIEHAILEMAILWR
jgi:hypothetical protein